MIIYFDLTVTIDRGKLVQNIFEPKTIIVVHGRKENFYRNQNSSKQKY